MIENDDCKHQTNSFLFTTIVLASLRSRTFKKDISNHFVSVYVYVRLRIDMSDWEGNQFYAEYDSFRVDSPDDKFALHVSGFHGNAGDSLTSYWENHDGQPFR